MMADKYSSIRNRGPLFSWFLLFSQFSGANYKSFEFFYFYNYLQPIFCLITQMSHSFMSCAFPLWNDLSQPRHILPMSCKFVPKCQPLYHLPQLFGTKLTIKCNDTVEGKFLQCVHESDEWIVNWYGYKSKALQWCNA